VLTSSTTSQGLWSGSYGSLATDVVGGSSGKKAGTAACYPLHGEECLQLLHCVLWLVVFRRAGVLLLAIASTVVFCSLFAIVKGLYFCWFFICSELLYPFLK
jgi:hypothetical protein